MQSRVGRVTIEEVAGKPLFLGIDSGSTTTKVCLVDESGNLLFRHYQHNRGNALQTACDALAEVDELVRFRRFLRLYRPLGRDRLWRRSAAGRISL